MLMDHNSDSVSGDGLELSGSRCCAVQCLQWSERDKGRHDGRQLASGEWRLCLGRMHRISGFPHLGLSSFDTLCLV